ncbi:MAG TPA: hypothetical protein VLI54_06750 [Bacillota bacterium]|nr:hypothetical protein [Bacillota bacterium]
MRGVLNMETVNGLPYYPVTADQLGQPLTVDDMRQGITATARLTVRAIRAGDIAAIGYGRDVMDRSRAAYPELYEAAMTAMEIDHQGQATQIGQLAIQDQRIA